jgi:Tfp pilus assembly protein PilF
MAADPGSVAKAEPLAEPAAHPPLEGAVVPAQAAASASPRDVAPAEPAADPKTAAKEAANEKAKSRGALERGNMTGAIASGERSVAIDPADAEAWLILGAAYQQKGDAKNAVRSFKACVSQGKRGPTSDCAAMLR